MRWHLQLKLHMLLLVLGAACAGRAVPAHPEVLALADLVAGPSATIRSPDGRVVVQREGSGVRLTNVTQEPAMLRQGVDGGGLRGETVELVLAAAVAEGRAAGIVRVVAEFDGAPSVALATVQVSGASSQRTSVIFAVPARAVSLALEYAVGPGGAVLVDDLRLVVGRATNPWRPGGRVSFEALELIADVAREVRYFSPEVDPAFDWAAWLAVGNELAARTPDMQALIVSLDEWVRQAAPGARLTLGRSRGPVPEPGAVAAPRLGPVIRTGATTEGIYVAFVDGAANEPATAIFSYWQPVPPAADCRKLSAVARVERLSPEAQGRLVMVASTGGFDEARSDVALAAGEVVLEAEVPSGADSLELAVRFAGRGELVLRELKVSCDGRPASTVPLAAGDLRGIGSSLYERVDSGCAGCVTLRRRPPRPETDRSVHLGSATLTYPLVVTTGDAGPAGGVAGGYSAAALNVAAAQLLYAEARSFAVKAPARLAGLRAAFHEATLRLPAAESVADVRAALGRILVALDDAHARVISPELDAGTLPFEVRRYDAGVVVTAVHPSFAHVLPVGTLVTAIDGQPIVALLSDVATRVSAATPGWRAIATARFALYGPIGSMAKVTYSVTGGPAQTALLPRVEKGAGLDEILAPRPLQNAEVSPGVRYLRVGALRRADLATVIQALQNARSIVLDLRGYGSDGALALLAHLLEAPVSSPKWGVPVVRPEGVVEYEESSWTLHPLAPPLRARIVALTDGRCVSSVETLVSLLRATGRVTVVGEPSAGTNGNIADLALPLALHAQYTGLRVLLADGSDHNERAPSVDVLVTPTLADVQAGRDVILERGIRIAADGAP